MPGPIWYSVWYHSHFLLVMPYSLHRWGQAQEGYFHGVGMRWGRVEAPLPLSTHHTHTTLTHTVLSTQQHNPQAVILHVTPWCAIYDQLRESYICPQHQHQNSPESPFYHHHKKNVSSFQGWMHIHPWESHSIWTKPLWCRKDGMQGICPTV